MKSQNNIINELQEIYQADPGAELRDRILQSANTQTEPPRRVRRRMGLRTMLIAAALVLAFVTTAFAYGDVIRQFMFGNSNAEQVEAILINNSDNPEEPFNVEELVKVVNRASVARSGDDGTLDSLLPKERFNSIEDAQKAAPFLLKEPSFLPESLANHPERYTRIPFFDDGTYAYTAETTFAEIQANNGGRFVFGQIYIGSEACFDVKTTRTIEKMEVNGTEALVLYGESETSTWDSTVTIAWIKDKVAYILTGSGPFRYDLDTMIAIAESV